MFTSDEKYLKYLINHNLSASQFLFCYLLATKEWNQKFLIRYTKEVEILPTDDIEELIERGYLHNFNRAGEYYDDLLAPTDMFKDSLFIDADDAFEQLWKTYPMHLQSLINGTRVLAKTTNLGKDNLKIKYVKAIGKDLQKHQLVMEALTWAISKEKVNVGIEKFILNHIWDDWLLEKDDNPNEYGHINVG